MNNYKYIIILYPHFLFNFFIINTNSISGFRYELTESSSGAPSLEERSASSPLDCRIITCSSAILLIQSGSPSILRPPFFSLSSAIIKRRSAMIEFHLKLIEICNKGKSIDRWFILAVRRMTEIMSSDIVWYAAFEGYISDFRKILNLFWTINRPEVKQKKLEQPVVDERTNLLHGTVMYFDFRSIQQHGGTSESEKFKQALNVTESESHFITYFSLRFLKKK